MHAPDLRGHGHGDGPGGYRAETMSDDVHALLSALGLAGADAVRPSLGGIVAYLLAQRDPGAVRHLVLVLEDVCAPCRSTRPGCPGVRRGLQALRPAPAGDPGQHPGVVGDEGDRHVLARAVRGDGRYGLVVAQEDQHGVVVAVAPHEPDEAVQRVLDGAAVPSGARCRCGRPGPVALVRPPVTRSDRKTPSWAQSGHIGSVRGPDTPGCHRRSAATATSRAHR
ncbi:hypothetical protein GCM10010260_46600 [Streptomyces filipinensis]|uniref:AB hydrolase-1 domain-containing protein n=1 Tax=Streptomyces filipinensis TaxID=66887 RepID=A0A918MBW4_9ACTN|nr:alpha/beta hydrolase [Streptomyces filipinensis]GGV04253.1 hypothetical protein GCM10010260_46600 [Streptomyces filipinensis]